MKNDMTPEQILEQIFDLGFATLEFAINSNKVKIRIKSLTAKDYLQVDDIISNVKGNKLFVLQKYGIEKLIRSMTFYNGTVIDSVDKAREIVENLPAAVVDILVKKHVEFERDIIKALTPDSIEENFFETPDSAKKSEQL